MKKCPRCGSRNIVRRRPAPGKATVYDVCADCVCVWESLPQGERFKVDGELMPFRQPCDNCAFRPGSPESQDKVEWRKLLDSLKAGGQFFCHKAVPMKTVGLGSRASFDFPTLPNGSHDRENLRLCRGFLNAWGAWVAKEYRMSDTR